MFRSTISILRSMEPLQLMSQRSMTGMKNKRNPFVKEKLPTLTAMETISTRDRDLETLVQTHLTRRKVKHGDYDFSECNEGYILCYINTFHRKKEPKNVFYGVFYGEDHPLGHPLIHRSYRRKYDVKAVNDPSKKADRIDGWLPIEQSERNLHGPVKGIQTLLHGKDVAILNAIRNFPKIEAKQLCICTDSTPTIGMMRRLPEYSENGYRMSTGRILERKDTYEQLTAAVRLRDDLKIRIMYTPADVIMQMRRAIWLATLASRAEIEQQ